jgi:hypothetical protein
MDVRQVFETMLDGYWQASMTSMWMGGREIQGGTQYTPQI